MDPSHKHCPNCRLTNPPSAERCDCGYDFTTGRPEGSFLSSSILSKASTASIIVLLLGYVASTIVLRVGVSAFKNFLTVGLLVICGITLVAWLLYQFARHRRTVVMYVIAALDQTIRTLQPVLPVSTYLAFKRAGISIQVCEWRGERVFNQLVSLTEKSSEVRHLREVKAEECLKRFIQHTSGVQSYLTLATFVKTACRDNKPYEARFWAAVVRPDRLLVRQTVGQDFDEWVTIGNSTWESLALMLVGPGARETPSEFRAPVNNRMLIGRFFELPRLAPPARASICRFRHRRFSHLVWNDLDPDVTRRLLVWNELPMDEVSARMHVWLWSDDTLAKVQITLFQNASTFEFNQLFVLYNHPIEIHAPQSPV